MPEVFESDNGTQLVSAEIVAFYTQRNVRFVTSSPEYPQSNGLVERHIQTVKRTILKMFREGKSLWQALAAIRSTPVSADLPSPSVLLQGRHLRGILHFIPARLQSQFVPSNVVRSCLQRRQAAAHFHHGGAPDVRSSALIVGQQVRAYVSNKWAPGVVVSMCPEPNSYIVRLADGRLFRRTRSAINIDNSLSAGVDPPQLSGSFTMAPSRMQHLRPPPDVAPTVPVLPPAQPPNRLPRPVGSTRSGRPYLKP